MVAGSFIQLVRFATLGSSISTKLREGLLEMYTLPKEVLGPF